VRWLSTALRQLILMILIVSSGHAEDTFTLADISDQLVPTPVLRADFEQQRSLRLLNRPLVSEGQLLYVSGRGVLWEVTAPQPAAMVIAPGRMTEFIDGVGHPLSLGQSPVFQNLIQVFLAALSGELENLAEVFEVTVEQKVPGWHVTLTPKAPNLADAITTIELEGSRFVTSIRILEASGDSTLVIFSDLRAHPQILDDREEAYFGE
jgi:hypothetical protein